MTAKKQKTLESAIYWCKIEPSFHGFRPVSMIRGVKAALQSGHTRSMALNHRRFSARGLIVAWSKS
jgi:hypothetical protein